MMEQKRPWVPRKAQVIAVDVAGRVPPHDDDAEAAVLSAVLTEERAFDNVADILAPEHFYTDAHRRIYEAAVELKKVGQPIDTQMVASYLKDRDRLQSIGGLTYLSRLVDATPAVANVAAHAHIIRQKYRVRRLIETCQMVAAEGYGDYGDPKTYIDGAEQRVYEIARDESKSAVAMLYDVIKDAYHSLHEAYERGALITGLSTGFNELDEMTSGMHDGELIIVAGRPGMGKALAVEERVLTPNGWRKMGDLAVGDKVIGADGRAVDVLGVYDQGEREAYCVTMDDGATVVCDDEHLWLTRSRSERRRRACGSVRTTKEIRESLTRAPSGGRNHSVQYVKPVQFARQRKSALPLDPWLLGILLGDGGATYTPCLHNPERDVRSRVRRLLPETDSLSGDHPVSVRIVGTATAKALRALGLNGRRSWEKFIPSAYLHASPAERQALLQGICDSDGYVTDPAAKSVEISTASAKLADDIRFLVQALGGTVSQVVRPTHYVQDGERHEARLAWRLVLSFPTGEVTSVSTKKHLAKWRHGAQRVTERFVADVRHVGRRMMRCIRVDAADGLYVANGCVVTHNTSYVLNLAVNAAAPQKQQAPNEELTTMREATGVMIFSLEMPKDQLAHRIMCSEGRVDLNKLRKAKLSPPEWDKLLEASNWLSQLPIWIDDTAAVNLLEIRAKVRRQQAEYNKKDENGRYKQRIGLVIIDYLQLMAEPGGTENREQAVAANSRGLKALAKELGLPVIALSQLNRAVETRGGKNKRPLLSDLRESGAVEQDADVIQFVYRPEYYIHDKSSPDAVKQKGYAEIIIAKQRNGPTGKARMTFVDYCARFENRDPSAYTPDEDD